MNQLQRHIGWVLAFVLLSSTAACAPSVDGEAKKWTANKVKSIEVAKRYPGLKVAIEASIRQAEPAWKAANALSDESKADKMKEVNEAASAIVGEIDGIESDISSVKSTISDMRRIRLGVYADARRGDIIADFHGRIEGVTTQLKALALEAPPAVLAALAPLTKEAYRARSRVRDAYKRMKPNRKKKKRERERTRKKGASTK